jgi:hypothetical protein
MIMDRHRRGAVMMMKPRRSASVTMVEGGEQSWQEMVGCGSGPSSNPDRHSPAWHLSKLDSCPAPAPCIRCCCWCCCWYCRC